MLPLRRLGWRSNVINFLMSHYLIYQVAGMMHRKLFVPFILPRLSRN